MMKKILLVLIILCFALTGYAADWNLADPGADRVAGWDDSDTGDEPQWFGFSATYFSISGTTISLAYDYLKISNNLSDLDNAPDALVTLGVDATANEIAF